MERTLRGFGSLGRRVLAAVLVVSLVPLLLAAVLTYWQGTTLIEGFVADYVAKTARAYASDLDLFLQRQRVRLRDIPVDGSDVSAVLRAASAGDANLDALLMVAADGAVVGRSVDRIDDWVVAACRDLVADPDRAMTHAGRGHAHQVVVAVRRPPGVLCGQVNFTLHQDMLTERASGAIGGAAFIVDRSGTVVCHAFEHDEPNRGRGDVLGPDAVLAASRGRPWSGEVQGSPGAVLAAFAPAASVPWGVWVEVSEEVAAAPLRGWLAQILGWALVLAVAASAAALLLVRRFVAPIQDVVAAVQRIAGGHYGGRVPVRGDDEISVLAQEFNRMSAALHDSYTELDARVQERTRDLAAAQELSDLLLDTMRERILVMDGDQRIVRANRAALEAYGPDIMGCGCHEVHRRTGSSAADCPAQRVLERGVAESEERTYAFDGRTETLAVDTYPLPAPDGAPRAVVEIARDVTAVKRMQARLMHQEKMASLGTLAAGLAHEIGNPLASMSSELEMLERMWDPQDARASLPVLRDQVRRMATLLNELGSLGRPSSDQAAPFDPAPLVDEVTRLLGHDPRSRGVVIEVDLDPTVTSLCTSRDRLVQVLVNLGLNGLDALNGRGTLTFRLARDPGGDVRFEVADNGPGVPDDARGHVFDPFFTTKPPGAGTGLGLFVSERIVRGLGGRLELDPQSATGAAFAVVLPPCACGGCGAEASSAAPGALSG